MMKLNGVKLREARLDRSWTQDQAAAAAGVSLPTYNRAENESPIHPGTAEKICSSLGLPVATTRIRESIAPLDASLVETA